MVVFKPRWHVEDNYVDLVVFKPKCWVEDNDYMVVKPKWLLFLCCQLGLFKLTHEQALVKCVAFRPKQALKAVHP